MAIPTTFVLYPDEAHVLVQPRHRLASMCRNLEWFSRWLLHKDAEECGRGTHARRREAPKGHLPAAGSKPSY